MKSRLILVGLLYLSALEGCSFKPASRGDEGALVVVADDLDVPVLRGTIEGSFGREIMTPQPEPWFDITWTDAEGLSQYTRAPLLLLATTTDGDGSTAALLRRMLSPEIAAGVNAGEYSVFTRRDPWAREQLLCVLVGRNRLELGNRARLWADSLVEWSRDFELARLQEKLFARAEQKDLEAVIRDKYGVQMRVQHDYLFAEQLDSLRFFRLIRHQPERWIMFAWGDMDEIDTTAPDFAFQRRSLLGGAFLDPVVTYTEHWNWSHSTLNGRPCILVRGIWATLGPQGGGPFFTYILTDETTGKYYMIDGAVFAPGESKMPFLWQLDALANTFTLPASGKESA